MKEVILSEFKPKSETGIPDPYTIAFVYTNHNKQFVIKGMYQEVDDYIEARFDRAIVNFTYWKNGRHRSDWRSTRDLMLYIHKEKVGNRDKWVVSVSDGKTNKKLKFRKLPRKWLPEYDRALSYGEHCQNKAN